MSSAVSRGFPCCISNFSNMKTIAVSVINLCLLQESQGDISHAVGLLTTQTAEKERGPEEASAAEHHREASNQHSSKIITGYVTHIIWTVLAQFIFHTLRLLLEFL